MEEKLQKLKMLSMHWDDCWSSLSISNNVLLQCSHAIEAQVQVYEF